MNLPTDFDPPALNTKRKPVTKLLQRLLTASALLLALSVQAEKITIAAVADLKFAMDEIVTSFKKSNVGDELEIASFLLF